MAHKYTVRITRFFAPNDRAFFVGGGVIWRAVRESVEPEDGRALARYSGGKTSGKHGVASFGHVV